MAVPKGNNAMRILDRGIVYSGALTPELSSCCFPALCPLSDGRILASFRAGARKGPGNQDEKAVLCVSADQGGHWSAPAEPFSPPAVDGKPTTLRTLYFLEISPGHLLAAASAVDAALPERPYYNEQTEGLKNTYIVTSRSRDGGKTWEPLRRIQSRRFPDLPLPLTGAPLLLRNGRIAIQFEVNKPYNSTEYWIHHSAALYSSDGGNTWDSECVITGSPHRYYWDQRIDVLKNGRLADVFWTFDRTKGDYVNIHMCTSADGGASFTPPWDTGLSGQPGNVVDGEGGKLLLIYINRDAAPVIRLAESADGGHTWQDVLTVFDYEKIANRKANAGMKDAWSEMAAFSVGHPFLKRMQDGTLWAYFYSGPTTHRTDFRYVRLAP